MIKNALYDISKEAKENIKSRNPHGYSGQRLSHRKGIAILPDSSDKTVVARQEIVNSNDKRHTAGIFNTSFYIQQKADTYTCPQGQTLQTTGKWHTKKRSEDISYQFKNTEQPLVTLVL